MRRHSCLVTATVVSERRTNRSKRLAERLVDAELRDAAVIAYLSIKPKEA